MRTRMSGGVGRAVSAMAALTRFLWRILRGCWRMRQLSNTISAMSSGLYTAIGFGGQIINAPQ